MSEILICKSKHGKVYKCCDCKNIWVNFKNIYKGFENQIQFESFREWVETIDYEEAVKKSDLGGDVVIDFGNKIRLRFTVKELLELGELLQLAQMNLNLAKDVTSNLLE